MSIDIIGMGLGEKGFLPAYMHMVEAADIIAGGNRMLAMVEKIAPEAQRVVVTRDIEAFCRKIFAFHEAGKRVAVLADGDPLFFSVGNALAARAGRFRPDMRFWPNASSLQGAAAALGVAWERIRAVSVHGRADRRELWRALAGCGISYTHVCVLTGNGAGPVEIARELLERGVKECRAVVVERLGAALQKTEVWSLEDLGSAQKKFDMLNVLILEMREYRHPVLGAPDTAYYSDGGLITKRSARAAALAELRLRPGDVLWDIGAGTGAVGIESTILVRHGEVFAVERNARRVQDIAANRALHGAWTLEIVCGEAPGACADLPCPDRIFVGGSLSGDRNAACETLRNLSERLRPGGRLVIACVLLGTLERARHFLESMGWGFEARMVQVAEATPLAGDLRFRGATQVWLVSANKPEC